MVHRGRKKSRLAEIFNEILKIQWSEVLRYNHSTCDRRYRATGIVSSWIERVIDSTSLKKKEFFRTKKLFPDIPPGHSFVEHLFVGLFGHQAHNDHGNHSNDKCIEGKMHG